jgi:hypothetical protein
MAPAMVNPSPSQIESPYAVDLTPLLTKFNSEQTLDKRNEEDAAREGQTHSEALREEQGNEIQKEDPRILAGKLKVMRDAFALELERHATPIPNPLGKRGDVYLNPYEVAEPLMVTLGKQLERPINVNHDMIRAQALALGLDPADIERIQIRQPEAGLRFLKENRKEIIAMFDSLEAYKRPEGMEGDENRAYHEDDKHLPTLEAVEELETEIPAIHRARLYVNAERGFFYERDRWISAMIKRHPEAATHLKILDGCREYLHKEYNHLMSRPDFCAEISKAVEGGATWPTLLDLPKPATSEVQAA